jgi:hypothetical protein
MNINRALLAGLRFFIAFAIIYYLFSKIPLQNVISIVLSTKVSYLFFAFLLTIISQLITGYRLKFFTDKQGMSFSFYQVFEINLATLFYGLILPGGNITGGAIRFYKLSSQDKKMAEALASLALDRVTATVALCVVGIVFWLIHLPSNSGYLLFIMAVVLFGLILLSLSILVGKNPLPATMNIGLKNNSLISRGIKTFLDTMKRFQRISLGSIAFILSISIISQILGVIVYYILASSLNIDISFLALGWIRCIVVLITMIPISVSGVGIREGSILLLLRNYGIREEDALAFSLLIFAVTIVMIGLIGGIIEGRKFLLPLVIKS